MPAAFAQLNTVYACTYHGISYGLIYLLVLYTNIDVHILILLDLLY